MCFVPFQFNKEITVILYKFFDRSNYINFLFETPHFVVAKNLRETYKNLALTYGISIKETRKSFLLDDRFKKDSTNNGLFDLGEEVLILI